MTVNDIPKQPKVDPSYSLGEQPDKYYQLMAEWYRAVSDAIGDWIQLGDAQSLCNADAAHRTLRTAVDADDKYGDLIRNKKNMTEAAHTYYSVLSEARTRLRVNRTAKPNQEMCSSLYSFMVDINFYYAQRNEE